ncbi:hypothetical protein LR066_00185 [candidate division WOR-3 bacterium]|nr:hypothetical protein [candidate division WOR-3 bacterium]
MSQKISEMNNPQSKLPPGWQWVKLAEVCEINPRRSKDFIRSSDAPTTFIPMSAVDKKTGTITKPRVVPYSKSAKGYTYFEENDVLFAKITPCMQNGKHVIARNLIDQDTRTPEELIALIESQEEEIINALVVLKSKGV